MNNFYHPGKTIGTINFLSLLFPFIAIPCTIFSQTAFNKKAFDEQRMNVRKASNYYLKKKINPSPEFSVQYSSVFSGLQGYTKRDTIIAAKLINNLYQFNDILFYRLMRIRLEWEFKQHLVRSPLDSVRPILKNNIDSSEYYYMLALLFLDSSDSILARVSGFVKVNYQGEELVDWTKMKSINWRDPKIYVFVPIERKRFKVTDSSIFYYKLAIDYDPTEFHYLKELILFMSNSPGIKDEEIQQVILSNLPNYTGKEKKRLKKYLAGFDNSKKK